MANAQRVFELTMGLMDEVSETTGSVNSADTREYKNRALLILNVLRGELYPYSDTFTPTAAGKRPVCRVIENFESEIDLDEHICESLLPYGLAAHLLIDENPGAAGFFQQRYEEQRALLARGLPSESRNVLDIYGGIEYCEFGSW